MKEIFTNKFIVGLISMLILLAIIVIYSIGKDK